MKKVALWLIALTILVPLGLLVTMGLWGPSYAQVLLKPTHTFEEDSITVPPDYYRERYWASLPGGSGLANLTPNHQIPRQGNAATAVFYIHPTSYLSNKRWNAPLFADSWAWEMVGNMMATQASAFNACCDVYAPHYREATLWSFIEQDTQDGQHALEFAYEDVLAAFDVFLNQYANGRPFIIASHSQGTVHALRLLSERVNNSYLRDQLVAGYLIGYELPLDYFDRELTAIRPCESASDTTCIVHWATYGEGAKPEAAAKHHYSDGWENATHKKILCTNPLSWRNDEQRAQATEHSGALAVNGGYTMFNIVLNSPTGNTLDLLPAVKPQWTWAQCENGFLFVEPQLDGPFQSDLDDEERNYHTRDYSLFYQNIRDNAVLRAAKFQQTY
ncbi:MAG: DUF3089 domain-containing protein [Halioglobus sp.]